jgi:hypothetical protein
MQEEEENLLQEFSLAPGLHKVISVCVFSIVIFDKGLGRKRGRN